MKKDIIKIINFAENGNFAEINNILLPDLIKWKIAFLYSNERLIPIYRKDALLAIAESFGMKTDKNTLISDIQEIMISNKPSNIDVYSYMANLFGKYGRGLDTDIIDETNNDDDNEKSDKQTIRRRKATDKKNTDTQVRTVERSYIVTQRHNKLQEALKNKLIAQYGKEAVLLEENYVDVKLLQKDMIVFYEVKSSPYASDCIREALGQILSYTFNDIDNRKKRIVIVGQFMPNNNEIEFIKYIKKNLNIEFEYENIDIE